MIFVEVTVTDPSDFETDAARARARCVHGQLPGAHACAVLAVPNALAALLLDVRDRTGRVRTSTSSGPRATRCNFLRYLVFGAARSRR